MLLMTLWHVGEHSGCARSVTAGMSGHFLLAEVQINQVITSVQFQSLSYVLVGNRIVMLLILHVIVDVDLYRLDSHVAVRVDR